MLRDLVQERINARNMSARAAAAEIGLSHMTLNRLLSGGKMDLDTIEQVSKWLGVSLTTALGIEEENPKLIQTVTALIASEPKLAKLFEEAAEDMKAGNITAEDLREIIGYAAYKIQSARRNNGQGGLPQGDR